MEELDGIDYLKLSIMKIKELLINKKVLLVIFLFSIIFVILSSNFGFYKALNYDKEKSIYFVKKVKNNNLFINFLKPSAINTLKYGDIVIIKDPLRYDIIFFKRENLIMRVFGKPGDIIALYDTKVFVNDEYKYFDLPILYCFRITLNNPVNFQVFFSNYDVKILEILSDNKSCNILCTEKNADKLLKEKKEVVNIRKLYLLANTNNKGTFPHSDFYSWNKDNFGPVLIPFKGLTVKLNYKNIALYKRIIDYYEENELYYDYTKILINGEIVSDYTFKKNYFFVLSDNRFDGIDSRNWGFLPEDYILGKVIK